MKKICKLCLFCFIIMCQTCSVWATGIINLVYDIENGVVVKGTVDDDKGNMPLVLKISNGDNIKGILTTTSTYVSETQVIYEFEPYKFGRYANSGEYTFTVSGNYMDEEFTDSIWYYGFDTCFETIKEFAEKLAEKDISAAGNILANKSSELNVKPYYSQLGAKGKLTFDKLISNKIYALPDDIATDENKQIAEAQINKFKTDYYEICTIASFMDINTPKQLSAYLEKYGRKLEIAADKQKYDYLVSAMPKSEMTDKIMSSGDINSVSAVKDRIYETAILAEIQTEHFNRTREIMEKFPELFDICEENKNKLSDIELSNVYPKIAQEDYNTYKEVTEAFDKEVNSMLSNDDSSSFGGGAGGGSTGGWGTSGTSSVSLPVIKPAEKIYFNDMGEAAWAKEAVDYLYENKIINGTEDGTFSPNRLVTRGEVAKMIVLSTGIEVKKYKRNVFADVSETDWFADYVYTAKINSIVKGFPDGNFMPNEKVSREDVAVMVQRAFNIENSTETYAFKDNDLISEYAVDAVNSLYSKKLINGMGDDYFAPKENATRAQISRILYNILK